MKVFSIDVSRKSSGFSSLYDEILKYGKYCVCPGTIVVVTEKDELPICDSLISITEVNDITEEIKYVGVIQWVRDELSRKYLASAQNEVQERTTAMYDILKTANQKLKEGGIVNE